ncbi:phage portal protein [Fibrella forsythiae]|uniref:Phage portal protein n=1 Tax=Fibrella forsythiae TaxID=2817061 RepID=A0ABS3JC31_9BACT|nr:phage portal protein [Fibrella forsythiae]MBO0947538.1 phage portal protein [Fibrella forsythiae]
MSFLSDLSAGVGFASRTVAASPSQASAAPGFATAQPVSGLLAASLTNFLSPDQSSDLKKGYGGNPYVFVAANWKATRFAQAPPLLYDIKDKKSYQQFMRRKSADRADDIELRRKALEEVEPTGSLANLLKKPNPTQTWAQLMFAISIYYDFGNSLTRGIVLDEGKKDERVTELWNLPTARWSGVEADLVGYKSYIDGAGQRLPASEVLHLRRFAADVADTDSSLWGKSLLYGAALLLARSNGAFTAEAALMANGGKKTLIFPKGSTWNPNSELSFEKATKMAQRKVEGAKHGGVAGFNVELDKLEIGGSAVDLNLLESNQLSREDTCAVWKLNVLAVYSSMQSSTFANLKEANVSSLRMGVLPDQALVYEWLTDFVFRGEQKGKRVLLPDTDVYTELQPDWKGLGERADAAMLSLNERRRLFGDTPYNSPEADIPLVKVGAGYAPITDFAPGTGGTGNVEDDEKMY